ncbi:uncharacterized protein EI97DRAFT_123828 [Westerdykella ornata]|uniref:Uncharacterized protein n=1 Tax=Westerdykella ornata TaxID=318751 RepID=A0A6A6JV42_WESOR|nr:uncharacterized protein EI97DRAFT_123828 [Westerdykella ornata]KAF2280462.1 hypothetical protein EI97DRAFT_123828 [Westerdykella ornata]
MRSVAKMNAHIKSAEENLQGSRDAIAALEDDLKALQILAISPKLYFAAENAPRAAREAKLQLDLARYRLTEVENEKQALSIKYLAARQSQEDLKSRNKELVEKVMGLERRVVELSSEKDDGMGDRKDSGTGVADTGMPDHKDDRYKSKIRNTSNVEKGVEKGAKSKKSRKTAPHEVEETDVSLERMRTTTKTPVELEYALTNAKKEIQALKSRLEHIRAERDRLLADVEAAVPSYIYEAQLRDVHANANEELARTGGQLEELRQAHDWAVRSYWSILEQLDAAKALNVQLTAELDEARIEQEELCKQLEETLPECCTGQLDCTSCVYHLTRALRISQSAENAALEMADQANMERMRTWNELQEIKWSLAQRPATNRLSFALPTIQEEDGDGNECGSQNVAANRERRMVVENNLFVEEAEASQDGDGDSDDESIVIVLESEAAESRAATIRAPPPSSVEDAQVDAVVMGHRSADSISVPSREEPAPLIAIDTWEAEALSERISPSASRFTTSEWQKSSVPVLDSANVVRTEPAVKDVGTDIRLASPALSTKEDDTKGTNMAQSSTAPSNQPTTSRSVSASKRASERLNDRRQRVCPDCYGFARRSFLTHLTGLKPEARSRQTREA